MRQKAMKWIIFMVAILAAASGFTIWLYSGFFSPKRVPTRARQVINLMVVCPGGCDTIGRTVYDERH